MKINEFSSLTIVYNKYKTKMNKRDAYFYYQYIFVEETVNKSVLSAIVKKP